MSSLVIKSLLKKFYKIRVPGEKVVVHLKQFNIHARDLNRQQRLESMLEWMKLGYSKRVIARKLGIQTVALIQWCKNNNLNKLPVYQKWAANNDMRGHGRVIMNNDRILALMQAGDDKATIASKLGTTPKNLLQRCREQLSSNPVFLAWKKNNVRVWGDNGGYKATVLKPKKKTVNA